MRVSGGSKSTLVTVDWRLEGADGVSDIATDWVSSRGGSCCICSDGVSSRLGGVGAGDGRPFKLCVYEDMCWGTGRGELAATWACC